MGAEARPALVVDDDPVAREVLREFLRLCGLSVIEAQNGLEALLNVKRHRPEVVVLEAHMPRLSGLEALKRIRHFDPTIRAAVVTWDREARIHHQARALGARAVLIKPVDLARLGSALDLIPADPAPNAPGPSAPSRLPESPPQPAAAPTLAGHDARRRDDAPGFTAEAGPSRGLELRALRRRDGVEEVVGEERAAPRAEPGRTALQPADREITGRPARGNETRVLVQTQILVAEHRPARGEGEAARGLAWLVGAVRAFLRVGPARKGAESESVESGGEGRLPPAPGVADLRTPDPLQTGPPKRRPGAEAHADASPGATRGSGRLQEDVDATTSGKRTMSYYGILGLTTEPFSTSPDPAFFYESASHKAVLYRLQIAIKLKRGLSLVLGDVGMGKTTLSRKLFQLLKRDEKVSSHLILNPAYETEAEFLTALVKLFGITPPSGAVPVARFLEILEGHLFEKGVDEDRTVVLLIDEAQRLSLSSLELLRALLNYETNEYKLLQLILMGQMELLPRMRDMKNLWDRISLKCVIDPLDREDTEAMIAFRLRTAGYNARRNLFTPDAIQEIHRHSHGSPRRITTLCHDALEQLVVSDKGEVDEAMIRGLIKQVLA